MRIRRNLVLALVAGIVIGGGVVAVAFGVFDGSAEGGTRPPEASGGQDEQWPPADPEVADQTLRYLDGDAALVMLAHRTARELGAEPTEEQCRAATSVLNRDAPADQVLLAIAGIPDESLRQAMDGERVSLGVTLTRRTGGDAGDDAGDDAPPLAEMVALVQERLDQLEAAR